MQETLPGSPEAPGASSSTVPEPWFRRWVVIPAQGAFLFGLLILLVLSPLVVAGILALRAVRGTWNWDAPALYGISGVLWLLSWRLGEGWRQRAWLRTTRSILGSVCIFLAYPAWVEGFLRPISSVMLLLVLAMGVASGAFLFRK